MSRTRTGFTAGVHAIVVTMVVWSAAAQAQIACEGRCRYGVDGACIPQRSTYGYYQSQWRRWPVEPPRLAIPAKPPRAVDSLGLPISDLPEARDEADVAPEFPHLRKRPTRSGAGTAPPPGIDPQQNPFEDDAVPSFEPPDDESASRGPAVHRLIARGGRVTRRIPDALSGGPGQQVRTVAASGSLVSSNPLRQAGTSMVPPRTLPQVTYSKVGRPPATAPSIPSATMPRVSTTNPLRRN